VHWRPWLIVLALFVSLALNAALVIQEKVPELEVDEDPQLRREPLRLLTYSSRQRRKNFEVMGLDEEHRDRAATIADRLHKQNAKRYRKMFEEQGLDVARTFCPTTSGLPQPYDAMRYVVLEEGGQRDVIDGTNALFLFEEQEWFGAAGADAVYNRLERRQGRRNDATLMGVSALLLGRENEAVNERGPWSTGFLGGGSFSTLESENPAIRQTTAEYLALVHVLTEIANEPDGLCGP
jgi:hypothetical protein